MLAGSERHVDTKGERRRIGVMMLATGQGKG